jgi:hypothetical protein
MKADAVASKQPVVAMETTVAARQKPAKLSLGDTEISRIEKVLPAGTNRFLFNLVIFGPNWVQD